MAMELRRRYCGEGKDPQGIPGLENGTGRMRAPREAEVRPLQESQWQMIDWQNGRRMPSSVWERKTTRKERYKGKSVGTFRNTLPVGQKWQDSQLREGILSPEKFRAKVVPLGGLLFCVSKSLPRVRMD